MPQTLPATSSKDSEKHILELLDVVKQASRKSYAYFINNVFSQSFVQPTGENTFVGGEYIEKVAGHLQDNPYTIDVTGRDHFKSTRLYCDIMYAIFTDQGNGFEAHYFSYKQDLAAYHLKKVKGMMKSNFYFAGLIDHKPTSESIIDVSWDKAGRHMTVAPQGLLSFKRGVHAERIYVDDPLRDPENKLDPVSIIKINRIMTVELLPMVKKNGICRVTGTPQTKQDFFFNKKLAEKFNIWITGAIVSRPKKIALWPEWMTFQDLMDKEDLMGTSEFNQEYNAVPAYTEDSYIDKERLYDLCTLEGWQFHFHDNLDDKDVVAGFDIGKKSHPSHLSVFIRTEREDEDGNAIYKYKMIYSKWMDGWDYTDQIIHLTEAIEYFNISRLSYDNTRGEFESFEERGELPSEMEPIAFGHRNKRGMATLFRSLVETGNIQLIEEDRDINQYLGVNSDLDAMASPEGHSDNFWSTCLALYEGEKKTPRIRTLDD